MKNFLKYAGIVFAGVIVGLLLSAASSNKTLGNVYQQVTQYFYQGIKVGTSDQFQVSETGAVTSTGTLKIGSNGSTISEIQATSCDLIGTNGSQAASTTKPYDCAITGIASGDVAFAQLATSTAIGSGSLGWAIVASKASTTAGYVTVLLANLTGAAAVPSATSVGSSTSVFYIDN